MIEQTLNKEEISEEELLNMQRDTILTANSYIIALMDGIDKAINCFKNSKNEEGINLSSYIEEGIEWLSEVAKLTKDVQVEEINELEMDSCLEQLVEAYQNEDYTLMGDTLEFEIKPLIKKWADSLSIINNN